MKKSADSVKNITNDGRDGKRWIGYDTLLHKISRYDTIRSKMLRRI